MFGKQVWVTQKTHRKSVGMPCTWHPLLLGLLLTLAQATGSSPNVPPASVPLSPSAPPLEPSCSCLDTCILPGTHNQLQTSDGLCDDGGPGAEFHDCPYGTDCKDCGPRCGPMPPPQPPQPPPPPLSAECHCDMFELQLSGDALSTQSDLAGIYIRRLDLTVGARNVYQLNTTDEATAFYLYYSTRSFDWTIGCASSPPTRSDLSCAESHNTARQRAYRKRPSMCGPHSGATF